MSIPAMRDELHEYHYVVDDQRVHLSSYILQLCNYLIIIVGRRLKPGEGGNRYA